MFDLDWIVVFIQAAFYTALGWLMDIPLWGSLVMTGAAVSMVATGIWLLIVDIKLYKKRKADMEQIDEILRN